MAPLFITPTSAPVLEDLTTAEFISLDNFAALSKLDVSYLLSHGLISIHSVSHSLTSLSLTGDTGHWEFDREGIHFPRLVSLSLSYIANLARVLAAIVAPKLDYFSFMYSENQPLVYVLGGLRNKFSYVSHADSYIDKPHENTISFCHAFPSVRHASMRAQDVVVFAKLAHVTNVLPKGRLALGLQYEVEEKWRCQVERCFAWK